MAVMPPASMTTSAASTSAADAVPVAHDAIAVGQDGVAGDERIAPIPGNDLSEIDDGEFHNGFLASFICA